MIVSMTLFHPPLIISNNMKSDNERELSDTETIISKPKAPRKLPTSKDNTIDKLENKYLLLSKKNKADIKKTYIPQYKVLGSLLNEKENVIKTKTAISTTTDDKKEESKVIQVNLIKQTHVNKYFKSSKVRKLTEIEKTLDEKIRLPSTKRKINKINFNI
jgi:hypothetical protein